MNALRATAAVVVAAGWLLGWSLGVPAQGIAFGFAAVVMVVWLLGGD